MESTKKTVMKKENRPISPTRHLQSMPTYVVACAVQETLDDPQKLQLITNKRSAENSTLSIKSISPTDSNNSTKTFTVSSTDKLSGVLDIATVSEVKIDIIDENQCGDVIEKKSSQISNYIVIDNRTADEQPKIIYIAPKHPKHRIKPRKKKSVMSFKNIHFKYKNSKNSTTRRLEKYYEKAKFNTSNAEQIKKEICSNFISKVVSRSWVLRKFLAKENLLADSARIFGYDDNSLKSSSTITKKSFTSYTSQNTLVRKNSSASRNEDFNSIQTANSIINFISDDQIPYKSKIINEVRLSVSFNASKTNNNQTAMRINEKLMHKENLTSSETVLQNNTSELTSKPSSSEEPKYNVINYDNLSPANFNQKVHNNACITQEVKSVAKVYSNLDTFNITRSSSDFNKSSCNSDCTLTLNSETKLYTENVQSSTTDDKFSNDNSEKTSLADKVKNLGYYPMQTTSIDFNSNFGSEMNGVLITDNIINNLPLTSKNIGEVLPTDIKKKSVLRKPIEVNNMNYLQNNISLPNDLSIKAKLKEVVEDKRSCADKFSNTYPMDLGEMWERLTLMIELAEKRLKEYLADLADRIRDKLVKDITAKLTIFNQPKYKDSMIEIHRAETIAAAVNCERPIPLMLHKEIFVLEEHLKRDVDICVQCDLVQKKVIDQLMLKLSVEAPKPISPVEALKDYVEVLKPRVAQVIDSESMEVGKGDTVAVSTATRELSTATVFSRFKLLFSGPLAFLRENMVVLTSVPTFFIVLFCLYGIIVILMKPW